MIVKYRKIAIISLNLLLPIIKIKFDIYEEDGNTPT